MISAGSHNPVYIGQVIRNAVLFDPRRWRGGSMDADNLFQTVGHLFGLLGERQIDYLLLGGVAMLQYVEGRNTEDIDLIMAASSLEKIPEIQITSEDESFARGHFGGLRIDLLLTRNRLFDQVRRDHATIHRFAEQDIPCATVEGLLLLKLYALPALYREGNFARVGLYENDIATLLHDYRPPFERALADLAHHLSATDVAALRSIVEEIRARIRRFDARLDPGRAQEAGEEGEPGSP